MPQLLLSFGPDGMDLRLLTQNFAVREVPVLRRQILQFIPQHLQVFFLMMVDGIQGGVITLSLECRVSHVSSVNQGLAGRQWVLLWKHWWNGEWASACSSKNQKTGDDQVFLVIPLAVLPSLSQCQC